LRAAEAIELIRPAVGPAAGATWADFGAGQGTFTEALAELVGDEGTVIAVEHDARALRSLTKLAAHGGRIVVAAGDFLHLEAIAELQEHWLDGALFANALHFVRSPDRVLARVATSLAPAGRIVVVEYDSASANRWVPHPIPAEALVEVARRAGLTEPAIVARRPSAYHREMYCALMQRSDVP
jgi:ubiquinone/menaquinone biosynthesis C-methylase UbiE